MNEIINYTRLTTSDKLSDKFATCQAYIPQDKDQAELGQIFSHIEILSPWFSASQIGQTVINSVVKEYYRGQDSSELVNFEEAVKKVNESLAKTAQGGETEWIGKISGVIVLVNRGEIHFAQTGKSHAYLYRSGKVNHITEGLESEEAPHPLKTFSNLTSGTLQEDDKVLIANDAFFEVINPNELRLIISSLPPALAAVECAKILQNHGSQDATAIFLELTSRERLADLPPEQKVEAIYLDQQILSFSALSKNAFSNIASRIGSMFKKSTGRIASFSKEKIAPATKRAVEKTKEIASTKRKEIDDKMQEMSTERGHEEKSSFFALATESIKTFFLKFKNKFRRSLIHIGLYTRKKSKMYLSLLGIVLVILALVIGLTLKSRQSSAKETEAKQAYNEIISLGGQADVLMDTNQQEAISKYGDVISLSERIKNTKYYDQAKPTIEKAHKQIGNISKLSRIDAKSQTELKGISSIAISDKFMFATVGSDFYSRAISSNNFNKIAPLGLELDRLTYISDLDLVAGLNKNKIVFFDTTGENLKIADSELQKPSQLKSFGVNLYVLDTSLNQILKIPYEEKNFKDKSDFFKEDVNVNEISDYAIDGSIYTLSKTGIVARYSRGNKVNDFQVSLPNQEKIDSFIGIFTTESSTDLLVLVKIKNDFRLLDFRKSGEYLKQYSLNGIEVVKSATVDQTNTKIFILSKDKVFDFSLE